MRELLDKVVTGLIALGGLVLVVVLAMVMVWRGPALQRDICGDCGLQRKRSVWHFPGTRFAVFWHGQQTNTAVGQVIQRQALRTEWKHRWVSLDEFQQTPRAGSMTGGLSNRLAAVSAKRAPGEFPAGLACQFDSKEVARFVDALHQRAGKETALKWLEWLGNPEVSPFMLGVAVRFGQEETLLRETPAMECWLAAEEATLIFGRPPDAERRRESSPLL
jgi:hypothetical protein